jgi:hypothetical protein
MYYDEQSGLGHDFAREVITPSLGYRDIPKPGQGSPKAPAGTEQKGFHTSRLSDQGRQDRPCNAGRPAQLVDLLM